MYLSILSLCVCASQVLSLNFNVKQVTRFSAEKNRPTYFGYAVLLQRGPKPVVIVGAPKDHDTGGAVYSCTIGETCRIHKDLEIDNVDQTSNFLGLSMDGSDISGQELVVCSPKQITNATNLFLRGLCLYHKNSSLQAEEPRIELNPLINAAFISDINRRFYNYGFAQAGFDVHLMKDSKAVLMGAPGTKTWTGSMIYQWLENFNYMELPKRSVPIAQETHGYQGYSVTSGRFQSPNGQPQLVIGGPRAQKLDGLVQIFGNNRVIKALTSDETGSYYGATLLGLDVDNDGVDELFVGAPFGSGSTFDEGYVYYYGNNFQNRFKLVGSQKVAARFGSAITSLGDIDYDSYKDVAISAPSEDDGVGAVYIYMGSKNGIHQTYSQRLSPLSFNGALKTTKGFGLGLSRGNDIDGNGHNDLAVGAYRSGEVFVFYGLSIIDYKLTLKTNLSSILTDGDMKITCCLHYTQRSRSRDKKSLDFKTKLVLDYRTEGQQIIEENWKVLLEQKYCKDLNVKLKDPLGDITPYKLSFNSEILSDVIAKGENLVETLIPYSHGCGDDNICQTKVTLNLKEDNEKIVVAKDKEITITVEATNTGETGYQCRLIIDTPEKVDLSQNSLCRFENESYVCPFATKLATQTSKQSSYKFDVSEISSNTESIDITFEIKCLGVNLEDGTRKASFRVGLENFPYIDGKSDPEKVYFQRSKPEDEEVSHLFSIGNYGPSPIKLDVYFRLPIVQYDSKDVFQYSEVQLNSLKYNCIPTNNTDVYERPFKIQTLVKEPLNETVVYDSYSNDIKYMELFCPGDYLFKSSQIARYEVKFKVNIQVIADMYKKKVLKENVLAYITTAYLRNSTTQIEAHAVTTVQSTEQKTYLWIYITVGVILGIILLCLLIYLLYRCHFFERSLRDKMKDETLINEKTEGKDSNETQNDESEVELRTDGNMSSAETLDLNPGYQELQ